MAFSAVDSAADRDQTDPYDKYRYGDEVYEFDYDDSGDVPWREFTGSIPEFPGTEEFRALRLASIPSGMRAHLHLPTLTVGERDRVVRFWVLVTGQGGGFNATFEGVRCNTAEYKVYAYANPNREAKIRTAANPKWQAIRGSNHGYRDELKRDYLCAGVTPRSLAEIKYQVREDFGDEDPR